MNAQVAVQIADLREDLPLLERGTLFHEPIGTRGVSETKLNQMVVLVGQCYAQRIERRDAIEKLKGIRRRQTLPEAAPPTTGGECVPIILFINQQSPCTAAVNIAGVSMLSAAIDLRMLDMYIDAVVHGSTVKSLPWESILKPPKATAATEGLSGELQALYRTMLHYRTRCADLHVRQTQPWWWQCI